jgi:hypothetical protein
MKKTLIVHSLSRKWTKKLKQLSNKQIRQENKKEIISGNTD